jgi:hypothetical protein
MKRKLYFADKVDKINEKLATQTRTVVITEQSFYNIGGLCLKITRRILIKNIGPISTHSCTHCTIWTQSNFGFFASFFELIFLDFKIEDNKNKSVDELNSVEDLMKLLQMFKVMFENVKMIFKTS